MATYIDPKAGSIKQGTTYWFPSSTPTSDSSGKGKASKMKKNMIMPEGYSYGAYRFKYHPKTKKYWGLLLANYNHKKYAGKYPCYKAKYAKPFSHRGKADTAIWAGVPFHIPGMDELEHFAKTGEIGGPPKEEPKKDPPKQEEPVQEPVEETVPAPKEEKQVTRNDSVLDAVANRYEDAPKGMKTTRIKTEYDIFPEDYFSGCDTSIYIGDTWVEDVTGLSFTLYENVKPLYGYNSFTYDQVARGARLVEGQFKIAFREAGYLWTILDHVSQLAHKAQPHFAYQFNEGTGGQVPDYVSVAQMKIEESLKYYGDSADKPFQGRIKEFEQNVWGRAFTDDTAHRNRTYFYNQRRDVDTAYLLGSGFDIFVTYGPLEALRMANGGQLPAESDVNTTVKSIRGVQITDVSQTLDWSGEPIEEVYSFIAQDLD